MTTQPTRYNMPADKNLAVFISVILLGIALLLAAPTTAVASCDPLTDVTSTSSSGTGSLREAIATTCDGGLIDT